MLTQSAERLTKIPPQNLEAEQSILGSILIENEALPKAIEILRGEEDFHKPAHRKIYNAMLDLFEKNLSIDLVTITDRLRKGDMLDAVGGAEYLVSLVDATPSAARVREYCRLVRDKALLRQLINSGSEIVQLAFEDSEDADAVIDRAEKMIFDVSQDRARQSFFAIKNIVKDSLEYVDKLYNRKELITGVATGFRDLDEKTSGFQKGDLIIIAGRPSMGKTAFVLNIAQHAGRLPDDKTGPIAIFSLEMSKEQLVLRMLCAEARVSSQKVRTGYISKSDWSKLSTATGHLYDASIFIDDTASMTVLDIRAKARRLMVEHGELGMIVVDYLQLIRSRGRIENRVQEISEITRSLKILAKELNVPVVVLSQLSRAVEHREGSRPKLADLRDSGSIEQDADVVIFIYREDFYNAEKKPGIAEIIIGKQRNGPTGTIELAFQKEFTRFVDLADIEEEAVAYEDNSSFGPEGL